MANTGRVTILGLKALIAKTDRRSRLDATGLVNGAAGIALGNIREATKVDTGNLKGSIKAKPATKSGNKIESSIYTPLEYAPYVEFGTGVRGAASLPYTPKDGVPTYSPNHAGQLAQPYMHTGLEMSKPAIKKYTRDELKRILK